MASLGMSTACPLPSGSYKGCHCRGELQAHSDPSAGAGPPGAAPPPPPPPGHSLCAVLTTPWLPHHQHLLIGDAMKGPSARWRGEAGHGVQRRAEGGRW